MQMSKVPIISGYEVYGFLAEGIYECGGGFSNSTEWQLNSTQIFIFFKLMQVCAKQTSKNLPCHDTDEHITSKT